LQAPLLNLSCAFLLALLCACGGAEPRQQQTTSPPSLTDGPAETEFTTAPLATPSLGGIENLLLGGCNPDQGNVTESGMHLLDLSSCTVSTLTEHPGDGDAAWSPDGLRLAFVRTEKRDEPFPGEILDSGVYVMDLERRDLTRLSEDGVFAIGPSWSPDGTRLAYQAHEPGKVLGEVEQLELRVSEVNTLTRFRAIFDVPRCYWFEWSPDGAQILLYGCEEDREARVINADGSDLRTFEEAFAADWSPEVQQIAYTCEAGYDFYGDSEICLYKLRTNEIASVGRGRSPSWLPDGRLSFWRGSEYFIWDPDTGPVVSSTQPDPLAADLSWLSDRYISYSKCNPENITPCPVQLWLADSQSENSVPILEVGACSSSPEWSPDLMRIVFTTNMAPGTTACY
jgi:dipeptidyl aminopeptidase/acylaminoacyl peptidase